MLRRKVWDDSEVMLHEGPLGEQIHVRLRNGSEHRVQRDLQHTPRGVRAVARHLGVAADPGALDFSVVCLPRAVTASAVYTRSLCASPAVIFDRENTDKGSIQLVCVISKNASVFTSSARADIERIADALCREFAVERSHVLISCTGVIGRQLPVERITSGLSGLSAELREDALNDVANAILTTDKRAKCASIRVGDLVVGGYAKGAGMIEPNMATMLVYLYTNARVAKADLDRVFKRAVDRTFNALSVDSDTSTSDTALLLATAERDVDLDTLELALSAVCLELARAIAREAEGATKLIEATVSLPTSSADALFFAKKIINSPLVKSAVHGADPNWGRIVMAIGKPLAGSPVLAIDPDQVTIRLQGQTVYERGAALPFDASALSNGIRSAATVRIEVRLGTGVHAATAWGCDLSPEYVAENAHYTS